ncbi:enoyl-CoA hydratase-related protein (plasmid) [Streptomyces sp. NBC_01176]|nr:enoyl-CoA hydratase-related protein [Streptomyces sp. NBC_01176]
MRLPRLIGPAHAAEVILTGRSFSADEAFRVSWVNTVLPAEDFRQAALRWADSVAEHFGPALFAAKESIVTGSRLPFHEAVSAERRLFSGLTAGLGAGGGSPVGSAAS